MVFWPSVFLEAWGAKAKTPHFFKIIMVFGPCRLRRQGRKPLVSGTSVVCLGIPGLQQKHLAKQPLQDPFDVNGPKTGPKLPEPKARPPGDLFLGIRPESRNRPQNPRPGLDVHVTQPASRGYPMPHPSPPNAQRNHTAIRRTHECWVRPLMALVLAMCCNLTTLCN